jgi:FkbM family methyltransferase
MKNINSKEVIWKSLYGLVEIEAEDSPQIIYLKKIKKIEEKLLKMILKKGFTCLDIGFNYGWFSYNFLKNIGKEGRVFAWEPNKFLYENYLKKWPFKNLIKYNSAVSNKTGTQKFYIKGYNGQYSGWNTLEETDNNVIEISDVDTISLDDWWAKNAKIKVDIIKIDAERHDYKILLGAEKFIAESKPKYILIEQDDELIFNFMKKNNYEEDIITKKLGLTDILWKIKE